MNGAPVPQGSFALVARNFGGDGGLDRPAFRAILDRNARSPLDGIVILGSNGESALLGEPEMLG